MRTWFLPAAALLLYTLQDAAAIEVPVIAGARFTVPLTSLKEIRFKTTLRQQYDFSCGSAAVATLLTHHYGHPVSEQFVFEQMFLRGDQGKIRKEGFSLLDIKRFLAGRGFKADGFELPLQKLIDARLPAIVLVSDKGYHHFVVVKGMADGRVLIGDPAGGTRSLARAAFEAIWSSKLLFVIHDYPGAVRFNDLADWRAAPAAPLANGINRDGLSGVTMPKHGPGDF
jgi:predicted double-glycine peptidase